MWVTPRYIEHSVCEFVLEHQNERDGIYYVVGYDAKLQKTLWDKKDSRVENTKRSREQCTFGTNDAYIHFVVYILKICEYAKVRQLVPDNARGIPCGSGCTYNYNVTSGALSLCNNAY